MGEQGVFRHFMLTVIKIFSSFSAWCRVESGRLLVAGIVLLIGVLVVVCFRKLISFILQKRKKKHSTFSQILICILNPLSVVVCISHLDCARYIIHFPPCVESFLAKTFETAFIIANIWLGCNIASTLIARWVWKKTAISEADDELSVSLVRKFIKCAVIIICILFVGKNVFNLDISAILAGAGVAGLGFAFAAQNTIANIFGAVTIAVDRPFIIGDRIRIGNREGHVESLGLRSTKLRTLDGVLHIIPNKEMGDSTVENVTGRTFFKQIISIGLVYETTPKQMARAKEILHEILDNNYGFDMENKPPEIYFSDMKDWSLGLNIYLWFQTTEFKTMMTLKDQVLTAILTRFNEEGLSFAYPTSTNYIGSIAKNPIQIDGDQKA